MTNPYSEIIQIVSELLAGKVNKPLPVATLLVLASNYGGGDAFAGMSLLRINLQDEKLRANLSSLLRLKQVPLGFSSQAFALQILHTDSLDSDIDQLLKALAEDAGAARGDFSRVRLLYEGHKKITNHITGRG